MIKEHLSTLFSTKQTPQPTTEALSFYSAAQEFSAVIESLHPHLSWVGLGALRTDTDPKTDSKKEKKLNSIEVQSEILLDRLMGEEYWIDGELSLDALTNTVMSDWMHLLKEVSVAESITRYEYSIGETIAEWFGPGYKDNMSSLAANLVQALANRGILSWRAFIEHFVLRRLVANIAEAAKDTLYETYFLVTSAPDSFNYHGSESAADPTNKKAKETHHSFLYLMNAATDTINVTQFRTWHNYAQLLALHSELGAGFEPEPQGSPGSQLFANVITLRFPKGTTRDHVEKVVKQKLYKKKAMKTWHRKPEQLPTFTKQGQAAFWTEIMGMEESKLEEASNELGRRGAANTALHEFAAYSGMQDSLVKNVFIPELARIVKEAKRQLPFHPEKRKLFAEQVTMLHEVLLSAAEQKVQWFNTNGKYAGLVAREAVAKLPENHKLSVSTLQRLFKAKLARHKPKSQKFLATEQQDATELLALNSKKIFSPDRMTPDELKRHAELTNRFAVLSYIMGSSECYLVTALKAAAEAGGGFSGELATPEGFVEFSKLPLEERRAKLKKEITPGEAGLLVALYESKHYVELNLPGANQIWMVPAEYLVLGDGCRVDPESGKVLGPCNSLPLDDPSNEDAMPMTADVFYENLELLRERSKETDWNNLVEKAKAKTSPEQQEELENLLAKAKRVLIKDTIGLTEMLSDDLLQHKVWLDQWMAKIAALLEGPGDPILLLRPVVTELMNEYPQS